MGYMDFHSHILYGVDHGVQDHSLYTELLAEYKKNGITTIVFTPHLYHPLVKTIISNIRPNFEQAAEEAAKAGISVYLGCELFLGSQTEIRTIPINGRFALVEFPPESCPIGLSRKIEQLCNQGYEPVIAHVERYPWLRSDSEIMKMFKDLGCWIQVNVSGIENKRALPYIERDLVDIIADDNHGDLTLPGRLRKCLDLYPNINTRMESMDME